MGALQLLGEIGGADINDLCLANALNLADCHITIPDHTVLTVT